MTPSNFIHEKDEWLPPDKALGHAMHTVGKHPAQYLWCEKCGAHSRERARNLNRRCPNVMKNQRAATALRNGMDPYNGEVLEWATRRLTLDDVGHCPDLKYEECFTLPTLP